ncbi:hypothetical protein [Arenivirga flava]|uniref:Uncharacterized protein n=1 Tax=Arenivirga flava TaxID=1930060 RepID=A0AA37XBY5_9MICO|nr:hypothetical protein [Arenivirga flava]GMA28995.1 hypothetical protein GCM10025874_22480 [Arenivirga flava]
MSKQPSRSDRLRPVELIVLAAVMAVFAGLVVLMTTRDIAFAGISFGIAFIAVLVVLAMLALAVRPQRAPGEEQAPPQQRRPDSDAH